jgi:hypothetical protein
MDVKIKQCDCFIGWLNDHSNNWELNKSNVIEQCKLYKGDVEPKKLINSGHCRKFKYCPNCGNKTEWKKLINCLKAVLKN